MFYLENDESRVGYPIFKQDLDFADSFISRRSKKEEQKVLLSFGSATQSMSDLRYITQTLSFLAKEEVENKDNK